VATSGTHDTETLASWWQAAPDGERRAFLALPGVGSDAAADPIPEWSPQFRDRVLAALYASGSDLLLLPIQDVFGWDARINTPATVSDENWTWRLPWPVDRLRAEPEAEERARVLRSLGEQTNRAGRP
jgi:4-alpha-glucanotransferase